MDAKQTVETLKNILGMNTNVKMNEAETKTAENKTVENKTTEAETKTETKPDTSNITNDGEYLLTDGRKMIIKDGKITFVDKAKEETKQETEKVLEPAFTSELNKLKSELTILKTEFEKVSGQLKESNDSQTKLKEVVTILSKEPGADPLKRNAPVAIQFSKDKVPSYIDEESFKNYLSLIPKK